MTRNVKNVDTDYMVGITTCKIVDFVKIGYCLFSLQFLFFYFILLELTNQASENPLEDEKLERHRYQKENR